MKRSKLHRLFRNWLCIQIRYERWKSRPENREKVAWIESWKIRNIIL